LATVQDSDSDAESKAMLELKFEEQAHQLWRMERRLRELETERDSALAALDLSGRDWQRACESAEKKCAELEEVRLSVMRGVALSCVALCWYTNILGIGQCQLVLFAGVWKVKAQF
jgi:hypothetical protein